MSRLLFFLLLIATAALGAHLYLLAQTQKADFRARERQPQEMRIVAVTPPTVAARRAEEARKAVTSLAGAACVELSGITAAEAPRAREAFAALQLGERLSERRVEDVTRHWVYIAPTRDRRTAEAALAQLRRQGVADVSIRPDNSISLGVFSTEEAARRFLSSLQARGVQNAEMGPFIRELRELVMVVREPDSELVSRITMMQRDFPNSQLRAVTCPS